MVAHIRRPSASHRVSKEGDGEISRPRDDLGAQSTMVVANAQPAPPRSQRRGRSSFGAIPAIDALRNRLRILGPAQQPRRSPTGETRFATESQWSSPPELQTTQAAVPFVERLAVQLQARRRAGLSILHRCPCGGIVSCNGLFDGRNHGLKTDNPLAVKCSTRPMRAFPSGGKQRENSMRVESAPFVTLPDRNALASAADMSAPDNRR